MATKRHTSRVRLKDVAQVAGVSPTTVSIVLKDPETSRVGRKTAERILKLAKELNYRPNYSARSLVTSRSHTIGLVITTLDNPFYAEIAHDIIQRAKEAGYSVILSSAPGGIEDERHSVHDLLDRGVDGLILCSVMRQDPVVDELIAEDVNFVTALRTVETDLSSPPLDFIGVDNDRGAYMAVDHLIRLGHQRIAILTGDLDTSTGFNRLSGVQAALKANVIQPDPKLIFKGDFHRKTGYQLTKQILALEALPTAVFAHSDHMAIGVLECLRDNGVKVPQDMAVVGFDDIEMAGLPGVDLTTVSQKKATMGRLAMDRLVEKIHGDSENLVKQILLEPILKVRKTCGAN